MVAEDNRNKQSSQKQITEDQRFRFIGFEVFPGKPKDLFKSDAEKTKLIDAVKAKRAKGDVLREQCTLLEERVSVLDRAVLTIACLVIFASIFLPWYSAYNEIAIKAPAVAEPVATVSDSLAAGVMDTLAIATGSLAPATDSLATAAGAATAKEGITQTSASEEVIHGYVAKKKIRKEYSRLSGIGSFLALGSAGSYVFSSGGVLVITAILYLIYTLLCIGLPALTLYGIYAVKGNADEKAVGLKKLLRYNWIPPVIFVLTVFLSFFGAEYGFDASALFSSLGDSYGPGALLGSISWGLIISMGAFILAAAKGIEI